MSKTKYFLDFESNGRATLYTSEEYKVVWSGQLAEAGIVSDPDPDYTNKLDDFFQKELGINPNEWEIG